MSGFFGGMGVRERMIVEERMIIEFG